MSISPEQFPQSPDSLASGSDQPRQQAGDPPTSPPSADPATSGDSEITASSAEGSSSVEGGSPAEGSSPAEATPSSPATSPADDLSSPSPVAEGSEEGGEKAQEGANEEGGEPPSDAAADNRPGPIPAPSEPMQYRAIGLVRGRYIASADQFTQGILLTTDGTVIDAVLLGRIMSLVKNHLNLEEEHLWVAYPRTRQKDGNLHAQIVGVWEPETLAPASEQATESAEPPAPIVDGYFSVRGEVIFQSQEQEYLIIKIRQAARKANEKPKFFKLKLKGTLQAKAVGHFWELDVLREANALVIQDGKDIGPLPGKKPMKKPFKSRRPGGGGKPYRSSQPPRKGPPRAPAGTPPTRKEPLSKPIVKRRPPNNAPEGGS